MIPLKAWLVIAGIVASFLSAGGAYWMGRTDGSANCKRDRAEAALNLEREVRKSNDKIDKQTPFNATVDEQFKWVLQQSERFHKAR